MSINNYRKSRMSSTSSTPIRDWLLFILSIGLMGILVILGSSKLSAMAEEYTNPANQDL